MYLAVEPINPKLMDKQCNLRRWSSGIVWATCSSTEERNKLIAVASGFAAGGRWAWVVSNGWRQAKEAQGRRPNRRHAAVAVTTNENRTLIKSQGSQRQLAATAALRGGNKISQHSNKENSCSHTQALAISTTNTHSLREKI